MNEERWAQLLQSPVEIPPEVHDATTSTLKRIQAGEVAQVTAEPVRRSQAELEGALSVLNRNARLALAVLAAILMFACTLTAPIVLGINGSHLTWPVAFIAVGATSAALLFSATAVVRKDEWHL